MRKFFAVLCMIMVFSAVNLVANDIKISDAGYDVVQGAIDSAQNGDTLVFAKGNYAYSQPFVIKNRCKLAIIAKKANFTNRKAAVFQITNSNVELQKGKFNECEVGIEMTSSTIHVDGTRFKKNLVCIMAENSVVSVKRSSFLINHRAAIMLVGSENVLNVSRDNKFKNNYADICPGTEQGGTILTKALGTRINLNGDEKN